MPKLVDVEVTGSLSFGAGGKVGTTSTSTQDYVLMQEYYSMNAGVTVRLYLCCKAGVGGGLVYTANASYDPVTKWSSDDHALHATKVQLPAAVAGPVTTTQYKQPSAIAWTDAAWETLYPSLGIVGDYPALVLPGILPSASAPTANALYGVNIAKAWGSITCVGGGAGDVALVGAYFNVASVAVASGAGGGVDVTLSTAMNNTSYLAVVSGASYFQVAPATPYVGVADCRNTPHASATKFRISWLPMPAASSAVVDPASITLGALNASFVVLGSQ
jgi:hypothetical protein